MKAFDVEFYRLMQQFEKDVSKITYGHKFDRVSKEDRPHVPSTVFYNDGYVNDLFRAYMLGYSTENLVEAKEAHHD